MPEWGHDPSQTPWWSPSWPWGCHHALVSWLALATFYADMKQELWRVSVGMITHFYGHDNNNWYSKHKIKIKVKQGEIKEQDRKEKSFPMIFCISPFVSKPLPSAIQSSDLLLFCLYFRCPLSRLISALKKKNVPASEALWDWAQWANIPSLHLFSLLALSLWDGNRQVWHLHLLLCTGALSSGVPSVPSKAREKRKPECWEEKKNRKSTSSLAAP